MSRLRRGKLEVVVPAAQAAPYRGKSNGGSDDDAEDEESDGADESSATRGSKTQVRWIEDVPTDRFFLRVGLGRKASGSYYTPHPFVRFLVQETLGPQVAERSRPEDPNPAAILALKVLDPAMGSGHFLVEACRYLGDKLYEACRLCDEGALDAEENAEKESATEAKTRLLARASDLRARVERLPDPNDELVRYLPSRAPEGEESGLSQRKAEALARRLVAVHCLYGVDKNPLAVELAKLSLWLESYAEGLPLTFLDHRLVCGDSLTGPFVEQLLSWPGSGEPIDDLFVKGVSERLGETLAAALAHVRDIESSVGKDVADIEQKRLAKERLDAALAPFKTLAAAWTGGVMLGDEADDAAYEALLRAVASDADVDALVASNEGLRRMVELGRPGIAYDLAFPEVFHRDGSGTRGGGFDAVLGNPPWDRMLPAEKEFFAGFHLAVVVAPTKRERDLTLETLRGDRVVAELHRAYIEGFRQAERFVDRAYKHQIAEVDCQNTIGKQDSYRLFLERGARLISAGGFVGWVVPSAFHANEGATGVRRLYLDQLALQCCFSFENRNKLFEIDSRFKFAVVVAHRSGNRTESFECAFYLHDIDWLFASREPLRYSRAFVQRTGGDYASLIELRSPADAEVARRCFEGTVSFGSLAENLGVRLGRELNMTDDAYRFTPASGQLPIGQDPREPNVAKRLLEQGYLVLHEGKTFHQFDDRWGERPRYLVHLSQLADKLAWRNAARFYRLAFRDIASSTNERTVIFCLAPAGFVFGNSGPCERAPEARPLCAALPLEALANAFVFDWVLRQKNAAHVNLFILNGCPVPQFTAGASRFLAHNAVRLSCSHEGYAALWREQLGDEWRERTPRHTWPVLAGDDARWAVRAAMDAVVAQAYGLDRAQYEHVLASFSHKSYPKAPDLCLRAFDELATIGLDAFVRKHDPYADVPLVETLPKPVIDLPAIEPEPVPAGSPRVGQLDLIATTDGAPRPKRQHADRSKVAAVAEVPDPYADEIYAKLVRLLEERGTITSADAQAATNLDAAAVRPLLQRLVSQGKATNEGERRGTKYKLVR